MSCRSLRRLTTYCYRLLGVCVLGVIFITPAWANSGDVAGMAAMRQQVSQWVSQQQGISPQQVQLAPLDPRVSVERCSRPLVIDQPFSSPSTLRVRCAAPQWQLFVRLLQDGNPQGQALSGSGSVGAVASEGGLATGVVPGATSIRSAVVAQQLLKRGAILNDGSVQLSSIALRESDQSVLTDLKDLQFLEVVRDIPAGTPLRASDVKPVMLVRRGQIVLMTVGSPGAFTVSVRLEAQQDGRFGEQILLKNPESGRPVTGVVTGVNTVRGT